MKNGPRVIGLWEAFFCLTALLGTVMIAGAIGGVIAPKNPHVHSVATELDQSDTTTIALENLVAQQRISNWALGTMVGGFLTMLGSFAALFLVRQTLFETQKTLQETKDRNAIEMRAYLVIIPQGIEQDVGDSMFRGQVEIHNIGRSPAQNVSAKVWMKQDAFEANKFETEKFKNLADRTLLPDARMRQGTKNTSPLSDFQKKPGFIFVYGRVDYTDYLGVRRSSSFCHRYNKAVLEADSDDQDLPNEPKVLIRTAMARHHIHGNKAD